MIERPEIESQQKLEVRPGNDDEKDEEKADVVVDKVVMCLKRQGSYSVDPEDVKIFADDNKKLSNDFLLEKSIAEY